MPPLLDFLLNCIPWRLPAFLLKWLVGVAAAVALLVYLNFSTLQQYFEARDRRDGYQESVRSLQQQHAELLREQAELRSNGFEKERAIRERLLMVRPGEQILFIEEEGADKTPQEDALP